MQLKTWTRIVGGIGAAALVAAGLAVTMPHIDAAQDQPPPNAERMGSRGRGGRMGGPMAGGPLGAAHLMRDLNDAQREQIKAIRERHAERLKPVMERSRAARAAIDNAVLSGNIGNLQALSIEVGNAETELAFAQAQVQAEIFGVLTDEQKQKIAERRKAMEGRREEMLKRRRGAQ
jgi:Spy/CpxP family protein refolding chaperone